VIAVISEAHRLTGSRVAAVLVALALSGAPRLATPGEPASAARCCCPKQGAGHACRCAAHRAGRTSREAPRPCHAVAREIPRGSEPSGPARTWYRPGCGTPEAAVARPPGIDVFVLPEPVAVAPAAASERMLEPSRAPSELPGEPETPPPIGT
jgi:hypothetical protein